MKFQTALVCFSGGMNMVGKYGYGKSKRLEEISSFLGIGLVNEEQNLFFGIMGMCSIFEQKLGY